MEPTRTTTSMLNNLEFSLKQFDFEKYFDNFLEQAKIKADNSNQKFDQKCPVDKNAIGNYEVVYEEQDPYDCYMAKVDVSMGYDSVNTFYKLRFFEKKSDMYLFSSKDGQSGNRWPISTKTICNNIRSSQRILVTIQVKNKSSLGRQENLREKGQDVQTG